MDRRFKNFFIFFVTSGLWLVVLGLLMSKKDVVNNSSPVQVLPLEAKAAFEEVATAPNKEEALAIAIRRLPGPDASLDAKVAYWLRIDLASIDSIRYKLLSGVGITATTAEGMVTGYAANQPVVEVFRFGRSKEFFLVCANGLVKKRWPSLIHESQIGKMSVVDHPPANKKTKEQIIVIPPGGSLCGTLGMSVDEALSLAYFYGLPHWENDSMSFVLIHPGDEFMKIAGVWYPYFVDEEIREPIGR